MRCNADWFFYTWGESSQRNHPFPDDPQTRGARQHCTAALWWSREKEFHSVAKVWIPLSTWRVKASSYLIPMHRATEKDLRIHVARERPKGEHSSHEDPIELTLG